MTQVHIKTNINVSSAPVGETTRRCPENSKIRKLGYKIMFCPNVFVFHKDRNFKHFARQRFVYGSLDPEGWS